MSITAIRNHAPAQSPIKKFLVTTTTSVLTLTALAVEAYVLNNVCNPFVIGIVHSGTSLACGLLMKKMAPNSELNTLITGVITGNLIGTKMFIRGGLLFTAGIFVGNAFFRVAKKPILQVPSV